MRGIPGLPSSLHYGNLVNRDSPLNRGLVSWWLTLPQRGKGSKWFDLNGRNVGTLTSGPIWGSGGRPGGFGAVSFDGSNDFVSCGTAAELASNPFSVSYWVFPRAISSFAGMVAKTNGTTWSQGFGFHFDNTVAGAIRFWVEGWNSEFTISAATLSTNSWAHVVGTWSGATITLYINGIQTGTPDSYSGSITTTNDFTIGVNGTGPTFFNGLIDDMRSFGHSLTSSEVWDVYNDSRRGYPTTLNRVRPYTVFDTGGGGAFDPANGFPWEQNLTPDLSLPVTVGY